MNNQQTSERKPMKHQQTNRMIPPNRNITTESAQREARSAPPHRSAKWLVWSNEHRAYWRPNMAGYTTFAKAAGRYTEEQAIEICRDARSHGDDGTPPPETMIHEDCISPNAAMKNRAAADGRPRRRNTPFENKVLRNPQKQAS